MCGIVGYIGNRPAIPVLLEGLRRLEYRGYDSAGIAVLEKEQFFIAKSVGRLAVLEKELGGDYAPSTLGIGHTRWATHGRPSQVNAHPHFDCGQDFVVVHNGIIDNYLELKEKLNERGHKFVSETDTEVLAHLIEEYYEGDLKATVRKVAEMITGSYALVVLSREEPDKLVALRKDSPMVVGLGQGEFFIASDITAILQYTKKMYILDDCEMVVITKEEVQISDFEGASRTKEIYEVEWDAVAAEKGGYDHFMLKEIYEQPKALRDTMASRLEGERVVLQEVDLSVDELAKINKVYVVACGTAWHAGLVGKTLIERWARLPVEVDIASEFRYRAPLLDERTLVVVVSQSGETADTLAALREAKKRGARVVALTNVVGSSVSREAHDVIFTWAGPEIAVASTKAYTTQLEGMVMLGIYLAQVKETLSGEKIKEVVTALKKIPEQVQEVLAQADRIKELAQSWAKVENTFFIGRSLDWSVAMEGALKLKEISYIHAEAYAAGELKHGTLALVTEDTPVIALATQREVFSKTVSNIKEVKARDAHVIGLTYKGNTRLAKSVDYVIYIPETIDELAPLLTVVPLQLLAYYAAVAKGCDVDKPRNLAKSVTVE